MKKPKNVPMSARAMRALLTENSHLIEAQSGKINALSAAVARQRDDMDAMRNALESRSLKIARLEGYIQRVRETEAQPLATDSTLDILRSNDDGPEITSDDIINMPDREFNRLITDLPQDRLDRLMGKPSSGYDGL